ncbi:MAG: type VI secretion system protein TssL, partial [Thermodesulfobacteria bacterium]|nr:type VI secretion system protein TssL [Thermodesulfobacteriota bacterium]
MGKQCEEKKPKCEAGAPKWMTTFSDLMSLLMCFFVLLLSFSEMDVARFKEVAGSLRDAFGVQREEVVFQIPKG